LEQTATWLDRVCARLKWDLPDASVGMCVACASFLLVAFYVWILPVGHTTALRNILFFTLVILTLWAAWKQGLKLHLPIAWAWGLYAAVALLSLPYALDPAYSFSEIKTELGYGTLAFALGATWVRNETSLNRLVVVLLLGNAFLAGYTALQATILLKEISPNTLGSLNSGPGAFSTYLVTVLPLGAAWALLNFRRQTVRWLLLLLVPANLAALYFTYNRAAILAIIIEMVVAVGLALYYPGDTSRQRKLVLGAVAGLAALGLAALFNIQMTNRTPPQLQADRSAAVSQDGRMTVLWPAAIHNIRTSPILGGGFGRNAFKLRNPEIARLSPAFWHAHNTFLNKGVEMGLPGICAFTLLLGALAWRIWPSDKLIQDHPRTAAYVYAGIAMVAGVIAKNLTDDFFIRDNALMFWLLAGALLGTVNSHKKAARAP